MQSPRIAIISIIQETNTFSAVQTTIADFQAHGIWLGEDVRIQGLGLNIEVTGSIEEVNALGMIAVPIFRAWAMSGGVIRKKDLEELFEQAKEELLRNLPCDGLILNLHGAMISEEDPNADALIVERFRKILGKSIPIIVTHDLHANVTKRITDSATAVIGFETYPHIDQAETGRRSARLMRKWFTGKHGIQTELIKVRVIIPPEVQSTSEHPMKLLRELANSFIDEEILDVSLFPVQPWLDIPNLGFGITVTHQSNQRKSQEVAKEISESLWKLLPDFNLELHSVADAIDKSLASKEKPNLLVQSSDSPTSGSTGDNGLVVQALAEHPGKLNAVCTLADDRVVAEVFSMNIGDNIEALLGSSIDPRWGGSFQFIGTLEAKGEAPVILTGPVMNGQSVSMGRWIVLRANNGVKILVTQRPAPTFDPNCYKTAGIEIDRCDLVHIRSALLFRSGYSGQYSEAFILNTPGPSSPNLTSLNFVNIGHPTIPFDPIQENLKEFLYGG